jgi:phospholipase C
VTDSSRTANLDKIDHIVVLMLENRSFDHMLGYLSLTGGRAGVDGLQPGMANDHEGTTYPVHHLGTTAVDFDPDHSASATDQQIAGGTMGGFVASAAAALAARGIEDGDPSVVMGYNDESDVPVFDRLAAEFAVCDRWFSSVPGATLPNRLYALTGGAAGSRDDRPTHVPPLYHQSSFVRHLDAHDVAWRWYSFDPGTLRLADLHYRLGHHHRFGYVSKTGLPWRSALDITCNPKLPSFLEDAASGTLPSVAWIDPAFTNFNPLGFPVNDDHPPADIRDGQDLVLAVYDALASGPQWERSLLLVVYDEHGGFYDHVPPPAAADDEPETFGRYGVRVPAIVVSPWVEPATVTGTLFDHTSIVKTVLLRFCPESLAMGAPGGGMTHALGLGGPRAPGTRVVQANHLGELLTRTTPRPAPSRAALVQQAAARAPQVPSQNAADEHRLTDLQQRILAAMLELSRLGHPANTP